MPKCDWLEKKNEILTIQCHNCKEYLTPSYRLNVFSGGPFFCCNCGANVTEDLYGKKKETN